MPHPGGVFVRDPNDPSQRLVKGTEAGQVLTWNGDGELPSFETLSGEGLGDVSGPSSSVDGNFAAFSGTSGKAIEDSGVSPSDFEVAGAAAAVASDLAAHVANTDVHAGPHATTHEDGGDDELDVTALGGFPGGTSTFLRADGTFAAPPTGEGGAESLDDLSDVAVTDPQPGDVLQYDGDAWVNGPPPTGGGGLGVFTANYSTVSVGNSTAEGTLFSVSVPANTLPVNGCLRITLGGTYLNNTGSARGFTPRVKFGSTTLWSHASTSIYSSNAAARAWRMVLELVNAGSTSAQKVNGLLTISNTGAATDGNGIMTTVSVTNAPFYGSASEDTTGTLTFSVTIQHSFESTNLSMSRELALVELIEP